MLKQPITLFVGNDDDSQLARDAVEKSGLELNVFQAKAGELDFETPLLISAWGVFDSLSSIRWFIQMAAHSRGEGIDAVAGD